MIHLKFFETRVVSTCVVSVPNKFKAQYLVLISQNLY